MAELLTQIVNVQIESFGAIQRQLPKNLSLKCTVGSTVENVLDDVKRAYPEASDLLERCACAIGEDIISRNTILKDDAVIVLLSPVAGG